MSRHHSTMFKPTLLIIGPAVVVCMTQAINLGSLNKKKFFSYSSLPSIKLINNIKSFCLFRFFLLNYIYTIASLFNRSIFLNKSLSACWRSCQLTSFLTPARTLTFTLDFNTLGHGPLSFLNTILHIYARNCVHFA